MPYMFQAVSPPIIRDTQTVHTASGTCQGCLLLPLAWVSWNLLTLAVAASNLDIYRMLCVQFLSSWWWAEKPPETCRALTIVKNTVKRWILLVTFKEIHERCRVPWTSNWAVYTALYQRRLWWGFVVIWVTTLECKFNLSVPVWVRDIETEACAVSSFVIMSGSDVTKIITVWPSTSDYGIMS